MQHSLRLLLLLPAWGLAFGAAAQGVGIGTASPEGAAALEVKSSNQGFLPPRMTQSQRLLIAANSQTPGLLVYQTDGTAGYYFYTGTAWVQLGAQGPQGPQGLQGIQGPSGPQGPQGPAGTLGTYGDGSAGALSVGAGNTLDLSTDAGFNSLAGGQSLQFTNVTINGTLTVPSGLLIRATGNVTISGTINVLPSAADNGAGPPNPGISPAAPGAPTGGTGLGRTGASAVTYGPINAGGAGDRSTTSAFASGRGGGSLVIVATGSLSLTSGAIINANGESASSPTGSTDIPGGGGGAGGIVVLAAKGALLVNGNIRANGGNGANALDGASTPAGAGAGAGGGGGGGIVHLLSTSSASVSGSVQVNGGSGGTDALGFSTSLSGSGGGACGGNGGNGGSGSSSGGGTTAQPGSAGYFIQTVVPAPENAVR